MTKEELKIKLGNFKITKHELDEKYDGYEIDRKNKMNMILEVSNFFIIFILHFLNNNFIGKKEGYRRDQKTLQC